MNAYHAAHHHRIGLVVPSANTTMETEIPALLQRQSVADGSHFTFHSARLRLRQLTPEAIETMNDHAGEAVATLCDAEVDAIAYACFVSTMLGGRASVAECGQRLSRRAAHARSEPVPVVTSADALVTALQSIGAASIAMIAPYRKDITAKVGATIAEHGIAVRQAISLDAANDAAIGRLDQMKLLELADELDVRGCDALVLAACVQMPSLDVLDAAEQRLGLPVISAATATVWALLQGLRIEPKIRGAGWLLRSGRAFTTMHEHRQAA